MKSVSPTATTYYSPISDSNQYSANLVRELNCQNITLRYSKQRYIRSWLSECWCIWSIAYSYIQILFVFCCFWTLVKEARQAKDCYYTKKMNQASHYNFWVVQILGNAQWYILKYRILLPIWVHFLARILLLKVIYGLFGGWL